MKCRLCGLDKTLLKRSHILPDFLYKPLYDGKHRLGKLEILSWLGKHSVGKKSALVQSGEYEGNLFCDSCDNSILGRLEKYASENIYHPLRRAHKFGAFHNPNSLQEFPLTVDYARTKLYFLSLIFRMSISSLPFFQGVSLGPHEDILRRMIYSGDPGDENAYQTFIVCFAGHSKHREGPESVMPPPWRIRDSTGNRYLLVAPGFYHVFQVSQHATPVHINDFSPRLSGQFRCLLAARPKAEEWINTLTGLKIF